MIKPISIGSKSHESFLEEKTSFYRPRLFKLAQKHVGLRYGTINYDSMNINLIIEKTIDASGNTKWIAYISGTVNHELRHTIEFSIHGLEIATETHLSCFTTYDARRMYNAVATPPCIFGFSADNTLSTTAGFRFSTKLILTSKPDSALYPGC